MFLPDRHNTDIQSTISTKLHNELVKRIGFIKQFPIIY